MYTCSYSWCYISELPVITRFTYRSDGGSRLEINKVETFLESCFVVNLYFCFVMLWHSKMENDLKCSYV